MATLDKMFNGLRDACTVLYVGLATMVVGFGKGLLGVSEYLLATVYDFVRQLHEHVLLPLYQNVLMPIFRDTLLPLYRNMGIRLFNVSHDAPMRLLHRLSTVFTWTMHCIVFGSQENTTQDFDNAHNICMVDGTIFELLCMFLAMLVCSATILGLILYRVWHACLLGLCAKILFTNIVRDQGAVAANGGHLGPAHSARNAGNASNNNASSSDNGNDGAGGGRGRSQKSTANGARENTPSRGGNSGNGGRASGGRGRSQKRTENGARDRTPSRAPARNDTGLAKAPKQSAVRRGKEAIQQASSDQMYIIECLLDERTVKGKTQFLVKWKGYDDDSCEPQTALCRVLIQNFRARDESSSSLQL